eukprot:TRINITY_DN78807_c0_g1_i1.p1 TRINITY_DN78807_c0_g1~~TRINITY_DN78807_c0_g1_i1.p1  ORF type:complete len:251 (-),score=-13.31 TRINITY_DN78807_c0_g1_i1:154-906(-)
MADISKSSWDFDPSSSNVSSTSRRAKLLPSTSIRSDFRLENLPVRNTVTSSRYSSSLFSSLESPSPGDAGVRCGDAESSESGRSRVSRRVNWAPDVSPSSTARSHAGRATNLSVAFKNFGVLSSAEVFGGQQERDSKRSDMPTRMLPAIETSVLHDRLQQPCAVVAGDFEDMASGSKQSGVVAERMSPSAHVLSLRAKGVIIILMFILLVTPAFLPELGPPPAIFLFLPLVVMALLVGLMCFHNPPHPPF